MKMKKILSAAIATAIISAPVASQAEGDYILTTASTGGTYYPVGVALSTLTKVKLQPTQNISMSAISSAGSDENIRLLREGEAQFAILQGLYGYFAATGTGTIANDGKQENLRSITMLWQNIEQFIIDKDKVDTGTVADLVALKGEKMALGTQNSGTIGSNGAMLEGLGINIETDYDLMYAGYGPSAEALQNGQVAGIGISGGIPTGAITQLMASAGDDVQILNITEEQLAKMDAGKGIWTMLEIAAQTYPGQMEAVQAIAQPNFLATTKDISEEDVYQITKTIYENLAFLNGIHSATEAMSLEKAIAGLPVPLHPGAAKYYKEVGIEIPDNLMAK